MYTGRLVETGADGEVLGAPRHPYTAGCSTSALDVDAPRRRSGSRFPAPCPTRCGCRRLRIPSPLSVRSRSARSPPVPLRTVAPRAAPARASTTSAVLRVPARADALLEVEDLGVSFRTQGAGRCRAVDDVDLRLAPARCSDSSASRAAARPRVARCIAACSPRPGDVRMDGTISAQRPPSSAGPMQMVFQDPYSSLNPRADRAPRCCGAARACTGSSAGGHGGALPRADGARRAARARSTAAARSPAASASGSRSPGRSPSSRACSSPTSRPRPSTSRCRRRSCGCSPTCSPPGTRDDLHLAQPRRRAPPRRPGRRHVPRPDRRAGPAMRSSPTPATLTRGRCSRRRRAAPATAPQAGGHR